MSKQCKQCLLTRNISIHGGIVCDCGKAYTKGMRTPDFDRSNSFEKARKKTIAKCLAKIEVNNKEIVRLRKQLGEGEKK